MQPLEHRHTGYHRVNHLFFPLFYNRPVSFIGQIKDLTDRRVLISISDDIQIYGEFDSMLLGTLKEYRDEAYIDFSGTLVDGNLIKLEAVVAYIETPGTYKENMELWDQMVQLQRSKGLENMFDKTT